MPLFYTKVDASGVQKFNVGRFIGAVVIALAMLVGALLTGGANGKWPEIYNVMVTSLEWYVPIVAGYVLGETKSG